MRAIGCVLLISGFALAVAALVLLQAVGLRLVFVCAALAVEALGFGLLLAGNKAALGFTAAPALASSSSSPFTPSDRSSR